MSLYKYFLGIDIGKFTFEVNVYGQKQTKSYKNTAQGIADFLKAKQRYLKEGLCVLETTGGHEMALLLSLHQSDYNAHRANARRVKYFIQSYSQGAKTDKLDAIALGRYGMERHSTLKLFEPSSQHAVELYQLVQRRKDLRQALVAEKNRAKAPSGDYVKDSYASHIAWLETEMKSINEAIDTLVKADTLLAEQVEVLKTIPGIGDIVATELLAMMPELGSMNRKQVAALAGLAPRANDSGLYKGYRTVAKGREGVKPILFIAAMAARNSNSELKVFYQRLIGNGKLKMVALVALMRKIIVIANARIKEYQLQKQVASS